MAQVVRLAVLAWRVGTCTIQRTLEPWDWIESDLVIFNLGDNFSAIDSNLFFYSN